MNELEAIDKNNDWTYFKKQYGMFSLAGFNVEQCRELINKYQIYLLEDGRMNLAALTNKNIKYVAESFVTLKNKQN